MKNKLIQITMRKILQQRKQTPGFIRRAARALEAWQLRRQSEWAEEEKRTAERVAQARVRLAEKKAAEARREEMRQAAVTGARNLIEWANVEYQGALARYDNAVNIRAFTELTLNWSAHRVLSTHRHFKRLCEVIYNDNIIWLMLTKQERRFISDAFKMLKEEERTSIAGSFIASAVTA